jgi:hypothetical protein
MSVSLPAFSQKFKNVEIRLEGSLVQVNYELDGFEYGQLYEVHAYASHNDFAVPLQFVKGDVGQKVKGDGNIKKISWDSRSELGIFKSKIAIELRGKPYTPFLKLTTPLANASFKKGKTYLLEWTGGENVAQLDFQLMKSDQVSAVVKNVPNKQVLNWTVPKNVKPGKEYVLKISSSSNNLDYITSDPFRIKKKIPVVIYAVPVVLGGVYLAIPKEPTPPPPDKGIPDPLLPQ